MSAAEVIEQIRALPQSEQAVVREFVTRELATPKARTRKNFEEAKSEVFNKHGELLKLLSQ